MSTLPVFPNSYHSWASCNDACEGFTSRFSLLSTLTTKNLSPAWRMSPTATKVIFLSAIVVKILVVLSKASHRSRTSHRRPLSVTRNIFLFSTGLPSTHATIATSYSPGRRTVPLSKNELSKVVMVRLKIRIPLRRMISTQDGIATLILQNILQLAPTSTVQGSSRLSTGFRKEYFIEATIVPLEKVPPSRKYRTLTSASLPCTPKLMSPIGNFLHHSQRFICESR
mmetsp:Transcript_409/g.1217  ORF Transcript_409/g.1217 Transcript_409/m.1217 type:complete len:226 (+) Transcript_409:442-1119(+)